MPPFEPTTTILFALADLCEALPQTEAFDAPGVYAALNTLTAALAGKDAAKRRNRVEMLRALANQNEGLL